jgi:prolyl-tRNA synthetase
VRPRFGVLRGREFLMKDAYSFDLDYEGALRSYKKMLLAYMRTFQRIGITAIPMRADTGQIGGDLSHEFHVLAPTGESGVFYDAAFEAGDALGAGDEQAALDSFYEANTKIYAATDEKHDLAAWANVPAARRREGRGIEVGQIFYFGKKYSETMNYSVIGKDGTKVFPEMGSYGIGVSRLVGAIVEAKHDDAGIIWPDAIAPFRATILNLRQGDSVTDAICETLHTKLAADCLYDDREERAGAKFAEADLMGHPWQIIVGPRGAANGRVELKRRVSGERLELTLEDALAKVQG